MLPLLPLFKLTQKLQPCCVSFAVIIKQTTLVAFVSLAETILSELCLREGLLHLNLAIFE